MPDDVVQRLYQYVETHDACESSQLSPQSLMQAAAEQIERLTERVAQLEGEVMRLKARLPQLSPNEARKRGSYLNRRFR